MAGLNQTEMTDVLQAPEVGSRLVEVSDLTNDGFEAGFALYRGQSGIVVASAVHHPDMNYIEAMEAYEARLAAGAGAKDTLLHDLVVDVSDSEDPSAMLPHLDVGRLITDEDGTSMRTDLALLGHSHPLLHAGKRRLQDFLLPSPADIINYGEHAAANPDIVEGVIVTHQRLGGLALRLWKGHGDVVQRVQSVDRRALGSAVTEEAMASLGISTTIVTFNRHTGKVNRPSLENLSKLYVPPRAA